jgi:hypothetical protein
MRGISHLAKELLASQEGLCSFELVRQIFVCLSPLHTWFPWIHNKKLIPFLWINLQANSESATDFSARLPNPCLRYYPSLYARSSHLPVQLQNKVVNLSTSRLNYSVFSFFPSVCLWVEFGKLQDPSRFFYEKFPNPNFLHGILHFKLNPLTSFPYSFISVPNTELFWILHEKLKQWHTCIYQHV